LADKIIIADAGPLIAFGRIKCLSLLAETLGEIIAPRQVLNECLSDLAMPGAREISEAIEKQIVTPHEGPKNHQFQNLFDILGHGEASAIILALQLKAGLLIDEKIGRQTARKMNLRIIGTAGVLLLAKEKKLIELKNVGYYLSEELIETVIKQASEKQ
jgi:predicted nucleic acid-binding protein